MPTRAKQPNSGTREEQRVFAAIATFATFVVLLPVLLGSLSSRPDLYAVKPKPVRAGIAVVDWRTLGALLSGPVSPAASRPDWFGPEIQIAGYVIPASASQGQQRVARFLLVPEPGDWLNPPHLHPGEAIDVRMKSGQTAQLIERVPMIVCGRLSVGSISGNSRAILFLADGTVQPYR